MSILLVSFGGILGALLRYFILNGQFFSSFWCIILINAIGSLMIGCFIPYVGSKLWVFAAIGFCGAFTTFSTFSYEVVQYITNNQFNYAFKYVFLMNSIAILCCWLGYKLVRFFLDGST